MSAPLLPVEDFFDSPVASTASISPDGRRIAYLAPEAGRMNVWVRDVDGGDAVCVTHDHRRGITGYQWTDDPRWLLYVQDRDGDENLHLYRVDLDDPAADAVDIAPFDSGHTTVVAENPGHLAQWFRGRSGELFATAIPDGGGVQVLAWDEGSATGRSITTCTDGADLPNGLFPIQVTPDGSGIWVGSSRDQDLTRVVRLDVETGEETPVDSHPDLSIDVRGQEIRALDPHLGDVLAAVAELSDGDLASITSDASERRWVVSFSHDTEPGLTFLYDHATGESELLFRPYPGLDPATLAPMLPARSPITRVDEIRTPLLVVQGANDARVVQAESDNIVGSLRARGDVEYLVKDDEGHGFQNPENVIDMYATVERFLARHLGSARHEAVQHDGATA